MKEYTIEEAQAMGLLTEEEWSSIGIWTDVMWITVYSNGKIFCHVEEPGMEWDIPVRGY